MTRSVEITRREALGVAAAGLAIRASAASPNDQIGVSIIGVAEWATAMSSGSSLGMMSRIISLCDVDQTNLERAGQTVKPRAGGNTGAHRGLPEGPRGRFGRCGHCSRLRITGTPRSRSAPCRRARTCTSRNLPATSFREGRILIEAAKKYGRIVQHGTQMRSSAVTKKADASCSRTGHHRGNQDLQGLELPTSRPSASQSPTRQIPAWRQLRSLDRSSALRRGVQPQPLQPELELVPHGSETATLAVTALTTWIMARWGLGVETHPIRITAHGSRIALEGEREFPDNMNGRLPIRRRQGAAVRGPRLDPLRAPWIR